MRENSINRGKCKQMLQATDTSDPFKRQFALHREPLETIKTAWGRKCQDVTHSRALLSNIWRAAHITLKHQGISGIMRVTSMEVRTCC